MNKEQPQKLVTTVTHRKLTPEETEALKARIQQCKEKPPASA
jgi:hypothetical protein